MLGLIIGNVDIAGAIVVAAVCLAATVSYVAFLNIKKPQDYELEKFRIEKETEKQLVAYKRNN